MTHETPETAVAETAAPPAVAAPAKAKKARKPAKPSANGSYSTLRKPQVRILKVLAKSKGPLTRTKIKERIMGPNAKTAACGDALGIDDPAKRKVGEKKSGFPSLMTLGYVHRKELDIDGVSEIVFSISASGTKALAKAAK